MKILILEDNYSRINFFKHKLASHELFISKTVLDAIEQYKQNKPFDAIYIDHDLDDLAFVNSFTENTGYQFAKFLKENNVSKETTIITHSLNPVGAENICNELKQTKKVPFHVLQQLI